MVGLRAICIFLAICAWPTRACPIPIESPKTVFGQAKAIFTATVTTVTPICTNFRSDTRVPCASENPNDVHFAEEYELTLASVRMIEGVSPGAKVALKACAMGRAQAGKDHLFIAIEGTNQEQLAYVFAISRSDPYYRNFKHALQYRHAR